eukprot:14076074-Alexandrium_andersonii.AAC.1
MPPLLTPSEARGEARPRAAVPSRRGPKGRRRTAMTSRGGLCRGTSWRPLGPRNCGPWSHG